MRYVEHEMIENARKERAGAHVPHVHAGDSEASIESLKAGIAATRERIAENAEALAYKTDVQSRVADVADEASVRFDELRTRVTDAVGDAAALAAARASELTADAKVVLEKTREQASVIAHDVAAQAAVIADDRLSEAGAVIDDPSAAIEAVKLRSRRSPIAWTIAFVIIAFAFALTRRRS